MKSPCSKSCDMRLKLVEKYGNCHNENCPYGWDLYETERNLGYDRKVAMANGFLKTKGHTMKAHKRVLEAKRK